MHRQPGQLLQRLEDLAVVADQLVQGRADHRDDRPVALDVHVDVAVQVGDVEQALDVVGGDIALELEIAELRSVLGLVEGFRLVRDLHVLAQDRTSHRAEF